MYPAPLLLLTLSLLLLLLPITTAANPLLTSRQSRRGEYYLRTHTTDPSSDKNNLYVRSYHIGAGLSDVVLVSNMTYGSIGYMTESMQLFDFRTFFPWQMKLGANANYAAWAPVTIDAAGQGGTPFAIENNTLQWGYEGSGFASWFVCDWYHGFPQLFWRNTRYKMAKPCSCADVELEIVLVRPDESDES